MRPLTYWMKNGRIESTFDSGTERRLADDGWTEVQILPVNAEQDSRIYAWERLAAHPFFRECFEVDGPLADAMIEKLTDAVVIPRDELPEVIVERDRLVAGDTSWPLDLARKHADGMHRDALEQLAMARHLREHPPIDPARAKAVADALGPVLEQHGGCRDGWDVDAIAHAAVQAGLTIEGGDAR